MSFNISNAWSRQPKILVVEDSPADAHLLKMGFAETGVSLDVEVAGDGRAALNALDAFRRNRTCCDLLLLDLNLPVVSGYDLLEHIKSDAYLRSIPVVVLSGSTNPADVARCYKCGANSYISKPGTIDAVFAVTRQLVSYWFECVRLPAEAGASAQSLR